MSNTEQTLSIIKPDAVERNLDNEIKEMFKNKGFSIVKEKKIQIEKTEAEKFYKVHETKPFYNDLCNYLSSGPIVVMVLQKENAIAENRKLMGATDPGKAEPKTIRKIQVVYSSGSSSLLVSFTIFCSSFFSTSTIPCLSSRLTALHIVVRG